MVLSVLMIISAGYAVAQEEEKVINLEEVVVSATKTENPIREVPVRINYLSAIQLKSLPVLNTDEYLQYLPGVNVSRPFGIFSSKSTVTMRGLDGKEQGRVLVMLDGIPINKADGGSVNWNLIYTGDIAAIEVVKGPGSSLYGGNAMGGSVNVISRKPYKKLAGDVSLKYGTYHTLGGDLKLSGRVNDSLQKGFYWSLFSHYLQSDGYITQSEADQAGNPYIVKSNIEEWNNGIKVGYDISEGNTVQLDFIYFNDRQGTGEQVYQEEGNTTDHDTYHIRANYAGKKGLWNWNGNIFYLNEHYRKVNEYMKDDYTWYDVLSIRTDLGGLFTVSRSLGEKQKLTAGADLKQGGVDAQDVYYTSTDVVYNRGKMNTLGVFAQDEISFLDDRFRVVAGIRYDHTRYFDGAFYIQDPSSETAFMDQYMDSTLDNATWQALSPRLSVQYNISPQSRLYASYARGFRPSVLDDLCRSGRVRGGFKMANPELGPENLDNFEIGGDLKVKEKVLLTASLYYSLGHNFIYYVNSGDSIDMGYGPRPIYVPENIAGVQIYGAEAEAVWYVAEGVRLIANYAYAHSTISEYDPDQSANPVDITGNYLIDVPMHMASFQANWYNRIVNVSLAGKFTGKRWVNDLNVYDDIVGADRYPAYFTLDGQIWKDFQHFYGSLDIQNILDVKYYDSKGAVCPGRFITLTAGYRF